MQTLEKVRRVQSKQKETETTGAVSQVADCENYAAAARKLDELSAELKRHIDARNVIEGRSTRYVEDARAYIRNSARIWDLTPQEVRVRAQMFIRTGQLPPEVDEPNRLAAAYRDPDARDVILQFDRERRAIEICKEAIELQRKTVAEQKRQAIAEVCRSLEPRWRSVAKGFAEAVLELGASLEDLNGFLQAAISNDAELPQQLMPRPFIPAGMLSEDLRIWMTAVIEAGLIDATDPRLRFLGNAASKAIAT
jgi:hypothetical protein